MSEAENQPEEQKETIRELVVPSNAKAERNDGDRTPTKTERDSSIKPELKADGAQPTEGIRDLVVPTQSTGIKDDDRTPTKTERSANA